jgi:ActR/RegA family two-component response regulator
MNQNYSILHLDDDPLEHRSLKRSLEKAPGLEKFHFWAACQIEEFKKIFHQNIHFDFIILDIHLAEEHSEITGFDLIQNIKIKSNRIIYYSKGFISIANTKIRR